MKYCNNEGGVVKLHVQQLEVEFWNGKKMNDKINNNNERYSVLRSVLRIVPNIAFIKNTDFVYIAVSQKFAEMFGEHSAEEFIGKTDFEIFEESLAKKHRMEDEWILSQRDDLKNILEEYMDTDGNVRYDSISKYCLTNEHGEVLGIYGYQIDMTKHVLEQRQYEQELQYLFEVRKDIYFNYLLDIDDWKIVHEKDSEVNGVEIGFGKNIDTFCEVALNGVCSVESEAYSFYKKFIPEHLKLIYFSGQTDITLEYQRRFPNGEVRWVQDQLKFLKNPETDHLLLAFSVNDIEAKMQRERELIRRAETDSLTGVLNREAFFKKVQHVLRTEGYGGTHAFFVLDIDNFKALNDNKGHQVGDEFLIKLSKAVKSCFRNTDLIGRLGGDEFLVLMRFTPGYSVTQKNANALLNAINQVCSEYDISNLSVSIGISVYPENGTTFDALYKQADDALYRAKERGKGRYEFATRQENI